MTERKPVSRVKYSQYNGGDALPAIHIGVEPDNELAEADARFSGALMIHVQVYQMEDREAAVMMLRAVADTLMADGMLAGEIGSLEVEESSDSETPSTAARKPFNPQPRQ